jgi:hypothetical protein
MGSISSFVESIVSVPTSTRCCSHPSRQVLLQGADPARYKFNQRFLNEVNPERKLTVKGNRNLYTLTNDTDSIPPTP